MRFTWDRKKAAENLAKHGVSFQEAATVLGDPLSRTRPDEDHSGDETRFIDVGISRDGRLIIVSYVERRGTYRIISARKLTKRERATFEEGYYE